MDCSFIGFFPLDLVWAGACITYQARSSCSHFASRPAQNACTSRRFTYGQGESSFAVKPSSCACSAGDLTLRRSRLREAEMRRVSVAQESLFTAHNLYRSTSDTLC